MEARDRIIVALDVDCPERIAELVSELAPYVGCFKVGLELMTAVGGPQAVRLIHSLGGSVFYDGKFNDIPNTIAGAAKATANLGVKMFDVHASAGIEALRQARMNKGASLLLAVTVLTSMDERETRRVFVSSSRTTVGRLIYLATEAGCDGIVCSPQELSLMVEDEHLDRLLRITPGIRPTWAAIGDQNRIMTPSKAIQAGADYLVIGRPITSPPPEIGSPSNAARRIADEIAEASDKRSQR